MPQLHKVVVTEVELLVAVTVAVPVGVPAPAGLAVRVGVKVPVCSAPTTIDDGEKTRVVVVPAGVTARAWAGEAETVKLVSPG